VKTHGEPRAGAFALPVWVSLLTRTLVPAVTLAVLHSTPLEAQQGAGFQSMNPDISAIGDFLVDLSPEDPRVTEDGNRFSLREVELGIQAAVDPFFRADLFLGLHAGEIEVEEAYLTALALPGELQVRFGRFHLPLGKVNLTHRPELLTVEYPLVLRTWFGAEGFSGTGIGASRIFAPLGFFQELQFFILNGIEGEGHAHGAHEDDHDHGHGLGDPDHGPLGDIIAGGPERSGLEQLGFLGHLRSFADLTPAANLEVGISAGVGSVERYLPLPAGTPGTEEGPDVFRAYPTQRLYGANAIVRWRPPARGLYRSFRWEVEAFGQDGPESRVWGGFTQAQWQLGRRSHVGARLDAVQLPGGQEVEVYGEGVGRHVHFYREDGGEWRQAASGTFTFFPSEFSRFRVMLNGPGARDGREAEPGGPPSRPPSPSDLIGPTPSEGGVT
jgi:hypothetical protein